PSTHHVGDHKLQQRIKRRPLPRNRQPSEQHPLQECQALYLLSQHGSDAVENQLARLQELGDVTTKEIHDGLGHDLERERITCISCDELEPGSRYPMQVFVLEQAACRLLGET